MPPGHRSRRVSRSRKASRYEAKRRPETGETGTREFSWVRRFIPLAAVRRPFHGAPLSSFSRSLAGALALHVAAALFARYVPGPAPSSTHVETSVELAVELDPPSELAPPDRRALEPQEPPSVEPRVASRAPAEAVAAPASSAEPLQPGEATDSILGLPATASSADVRAEAPRRIDLGLDGRLLLLPRDAPPPAASKKSEIQRRLEAALSESDVRRGLSRGGVLIRSLDTATRAEGPLRGEAVIRVTIDGLGQLGAIELLRGNETEWSGALNAFRRQAAKKRVRIVPGSKGLRVTFSVQSRVQRASGSTVDSSAVGARKPSLDPDGLVPGGNFDVSDVSGGVQRLVYARVVSEEVL